MTQGKIDLRNESGRPMKVKVVGEVLNKTVFQFSVQAGWGDEDDYWDENFDTNKNCQQEEKIIELNNLPKSQCAKEMVSFLNVHT